jgi:NAD(P)-dependent dehydrogenase (short-subunit alcohol dehydrogenase family)
LWQSRVNGHFGGDFLCTASRRDLVSSRDGERHDRQYALIRRLGAFVGEVGFLASFGTRQRCRRGSATAANRGAIFTAFRRRGRNWKPLQSQRFRAVDSAAMKRRSAQSGAGSVPAPESLMQWRRQGLNQSKGLRNASVRARIMDLKLTGRLALVTGSTAGIGFAIASTLAQEGARVIVNGRTQPAVDKAVAELQSANGTVVGFAGDLGTAAVAEELARTHPDVAILVNNLGIFEPKPFENIPDAEWIKFFEVNVLSGIRLARAFLPAMRRANWGRIIFISSESGVQIPAEMIHYGMTKTAQLAVARGLAEAVAGTGITVNSVLPGPTKSRGVTDFVGALAEAEGKSFAAFEKEFFEKVRPTSLIKRFAAPHEVAAMVAYIASPLASATTGAALRVDGGVIKSAF